MSTTIQIKKSGTPGNVPLSTALAFGELAINYADGVLWYKNANGTVTPLTTGGGGGNAFSTISANGTLLLPDSNISILTINAGSALAITANAITDTIILGVKTNDTVTSNSTDQVATANVLNYVYGIANQAYYLANTGLTANLTVKEVYTNNANVVNTFTNISVLQFDADSDFAVVDESNNTVTIKMNSTFKYWRMNGAPALEAVGQDTVNFITDGNVTVEANNANTPYKTISFAIPQFANVSSQANAAYAQANAAYNAANNAQVTVYANSGSSVTTQNINFVNTSSVTVSVGADGANANIGFFVSLGNVSSSFTSDVFVANASCTMYQLAQSAGDQDSVFVFLDGVSQIPSVDYSVTGNTITFLAPPDNQSIIEIRTVSAAPAVPPSDAIYSGITGLIATDNGLTFRNGSFSVNTDCISRKYIVRGVTTDANETELKIRGATRIPVNANSTIFYTADIVGRRTDATGESSGFHLKGVVDNFSNAVADVGNLYEVVVAKDSANVSVDMRADDTNNSINIYVTGEAGKTIRWTALVTTVEVAQ